MTFAVRTALFAGYCLGVALINIAVLWALFEFSQANATASYVLWIPLVTLALIYQERDVIFAEVRLDWRTGLAILVPGAALMIAGVLPLSTVASGLSARVAAIVLSVEWRVPALLRSRRLPVARCFRWLFLVLRFPYQPPCSPVPCRS